MILVGDEPYYRRFGFTRDAARASTTRRRPIPTVCSLAPWPGRFDGVEGMVRRWTDTPNRKGQRAP